MSKGIGWHLAQGVLVAAYFGAVWFTQTSSPFLGAAGLELFQRVTYLNLVFITITGVACFSVCVSSERESGTLDLLRMTGFGPLGFLVGRWLPLFLGCILTAGGWLWFAIRLVAYPTIGLCYGLSMSGMPNSLNWPLVHETALRMVGWDTAIVLAQLFQREVREQTWDALQFLPRSRWKTCYAKLAGALFALFPGWAWAAFVSVYLARFGYYGATDLDMMFFASIVFVGCHVSVLVSVLFPRFTWTVALLMGVVAAQVELELSRSLVLSLGWSFPLVFWMLFGSMATSVGLHILIAGRIQGLCD